MDVRWTHAHACLQTGDFEWLEAMNVHDLDIELFEPQIVEWRHKRTYEIDGREVILSGQCDAIAGSSGPIDYKCTFSAIDLTRYHDAAAVALLPGSASAVPELSLRGSAVWQDQRGVREAILENRSWYKQHTRVSNCTDYEWRWSRTCTSAIVRYFRFLIDLEASRRSWNAWTAQTARTGFSQTRRTRMDDIRSGQWTPVAGSHGGAIDYKPRQTSASRRP